MDYLTMICDIKSSKLLKDREAVQYKLIDTIKGANSTFSTLIASPFLIILGDEWQGLLHYPCDYQAVIEFFRRNMSDIQFYCGIGVGEVSIHNFELTVNQLDGPAFYKARKALKVAKQHNYSLVYIQ